MKKYILYITLVFMFSTFIACSEDEIDRDNSIFDAENLPPKNEFDHWLHDNYIIPYNIGLEYQFTPLDMGFDYHLTPAKFEKSADFAQLIKYCWLEAYDEVAGIHFTKEYAPKEMTLVGSKAITTTPTGITSTLGTAVGSSRVLLYAINDLKDYSQSSIIGYMHIMHHEFSHILDKNKQIDLSFGKISEDSYLGDEWVNYEKLLTEGDFHKKGFISAYSTRNESEDYAEIYSQYLIMTDAEWANAVKLGNSRYKDLTKDIPDGGVRIEKKLKMVKEYILENFGFKLEDLRESVRRRSEKASTIEYKKFNEFTN